MIHTRILLVAVRFKEFVIMVEFFFMVALGTVIISTYYQIILLCNSFVHYHCLYIRVLITVGILPHKFDLVSLCH